MQKSIPSSFYPLPCRGIFFKFSPVAVVLGDDDPAVEWAGPLTGGDGADLDLEEGLARVGQVPELELLVVARGGERRGQEVVPLAVHHHPLVGLERAERQDLQLGGRRHQQGGGCGQVPDLHVA